MPARLARLVLVALAALVWPGLVTPALGQLGGLDDDFNSGFDTSFSSGGFGADQPEVAVTAQLSHNAAAPGADVVVAVVLDHADGWHSWPDASVDLGEGFGFAIRTEIQVETDVAQVGPIQWPPVKDAPVPSITGTEPILKPTFAGRAIAYVPVRISQGAPPGPALLGVTVRSQSCDDTTCLMPETRRFTLELTIDPGASAPIPSADPFDGFERAALDDPSGWVGVTDAPAPGDAETAAPPVDTTASDASPAGSLLGVSIGSGLIPLAILSFIGGAILNLTPCVLPVIPIKIMTLTQHAGQNRRKTLILGFAMFLGVTAFWAALGLPAALLAGFADPSRIFGYWFVTAPLGIVMVLLSLGMMGLFNITLPQAAYMVNPKADNASGSFLFGVMTGVLGLPCFGFVAGALIPAAVSFGTVAVIVIFTTMGLGMAAPYLVLAAFPQLVSRVPKTGPASELVKQVLGLMLAGFGLFFFGTGVRALIKTYPYTADSLHVYALAALVIAAGLWLAYQTLRITPSALKRLLFGGLGVAIAALAVWVSVGNTQSHRADYLERQAAMAAAGGQPGAILPTVWNDYSPAMLERALGEGKVAFVDFTADWCINCKVFEAQVLDKDPIRSILRTDEVAMIKVDLTGSNPDGERLLDELGRVGIPTWAVFGPGVDEPVIVETYTPQAVREAIDAARATAVAGSG